MKHDILNELKNTVLIGDGAMGSELMKQGLAAGECPELWNLEHPDRVKQVHRAYIDAGSRFVLANSFGGNELKLAKSGLEKKMREVNTAGVKLLKEEAQGADIYIAGDIGSTGEFLEPVGQYSFNDFKTVFKVQAEVLAEAGADCILIETMTDLGELRAAVQGVQEASSLPVGASMTFEKGANGFRTMMGTSVEEFTAECEELNVDIIGTNCGKGAHETAEVALEIRGLTQKPVLAFPNAGVPRIENGATVYDQSPEVMEPYIQKLIKSGINIVGGCCGTGPEHIKLIAGMLSSV